MCALVVASKKKEFASQLAAKDILLKEGNALKTAQAQQQKKANFALYPENSCQENHILLKQLPINQLLFAKKGTTNQAEYAIETASYLEWSTAEREFALIKPKPAQTI
jgi:hypothetical protein